MTKIARHTICLTAAFLPILWAGCLSNRANVEKQLMVNRSTMSEEIAVAETYRGGCPDVLEVRFAERPDLSFHGPIGPDGRLSVPQAGSIRVEGRTLGEIGSLIAHRTGLSPHQVAVRVVEFNSQVVFLVGQVNGSHRSLPYQGRETVLELLQRAGGITKGAEPDDVFVVRSNIADGQRPEVFHVDLQSIVLKKDTSTNIRLHPFDQIYVGETRQGRIERSIPKWMRPLYRAMSDTRPIDESQKTNLAQKITAFRRRIAERRYFAQPRQSVGQNENTITESTTDGL